MRLLIVCTQKSGDTTLDSRSALRLSRLMDRPLYAVARTANMFEPHETITTVCKDRCQEQLRWAGRNGIERVVFLLSPARAGMRKHNQFIWYPQITGVEIAFSPHPSGLNAWWKDTANYKQAALFWGKLGEWTDEDAVSERA